MHQIETDNNLMNQGFWGKRRESLNISKTGRKIENDLHLILRKFENSCTEYNYRVDVTSKFRVIRKMEVRKKR